jgi:IS30 family transposase
VQSRGALRRELTTRLRSGRAQRTPNRQGARRKNRVLPAWSTSTNDQPRTGPWRAVQRGAVPCRWEGDLITGKGNRFKIGTLVEHCTGYAMSVPLARRIRSRAGRSCPDCEEQDLPEQLRRSLTRDQGVEMRDWRQVQVADGIAGFFCDAHSLWPCATNGNAIGLLRQYWTDMSVGTQPVDDLARAESQQPEDGQRQ